MSIERVACPRCGAPNDPAAPQCAVCGAPLTAAPAPVAVPPAAPPYAVYSPAPSAGVVPPPVAPPPSAPRPNRGPVIGLALGLVSLCLVVGLVGGVLVLAPGGVLPFLAPPTPTPVDPVQVLNAATTALADVKTMHYDMVVTFNDLPADPTTAPTVTLHLVGDVAFPGDYTMHTTEFGDLIVLGEDAYVRSDPQQRWARRLASDASPDLAPTNPTALARFIQFARDPILDSTVVSGTQHLLKINFLLNTAQMVAEQGPASTGSVLSGSRVVCNAFIGAEDYRLYQLQLDLELRGNNKAAIAATFSNFNAPVTIEAPTDLQP